MPVARVWSVALHGVRGRVVEVEADISDGLPGFYLVGLPDAALSEARDRVRAALVNSGETWPNRRLTVSLSPADLHKRGSGFDLAVAVAVMAAAGKVPVDGVAGLVVLGELGLDGGVRALRGVLPAVAAAARVGLCRVVVPEPNADEAALVDGVEVLGVRSLRQLLAVLRGEPVPEEPPVPRQASVAPVGVRASAEAPDLRDVRGQVEARQALEISAAGYHHLFMHGSPGAGKTMLAERLPGLLPPLEGEAALEVTEIHSVAGILPAGRPLVTSPPFCNPHHTATTAALVGGGSGEIRPGAASMAHRGVLFLDEAPEFRAGVLDALRQPLESGAVVIARSGVTTVFPAGFLLVLAANPCPCGQTATSAAACNCSSETRRRYNARLSRPLLDRIDMQVMVDGVNRHDMFHGPEPEGTAEAAARVREARDRAGRRMAGTPWTVNAQVPARELRTRWRPAPGSLNEVERSLEHGTLTARGVDRVLRLAWTLADLGGRDRPVVEDVHRALGLRTGIVTGWAA
jgi:magnesium chelatase family protein